MYPEDGATENKILDLTSQESDDEGPTYICDHCEIEMRKSKTNIDGIFVAGDVYDYTYRPAVTAAGSGCKAAIDVINYLENKEERD